jgi:hypothetical protein
MPRKTTPYTHATSYAHTGEDTATLWRAMVRAAGWGEASNRTGERARQHATCAAIQRAATTPHRHTTTQGTQSQGIPQLVEEQRLQLVRRRCRASNHLSPQDSAAPHATTAHPHAATHSKT